MHARARRLQHGAHERDGRALAVGAGDMDDRRQLALGMAERFEQAPHAVERQVDPLGVERQEPRQDRVYMGHAEFVMGAGFQGLEVSMPGVLRHFAGIVMGFVHDE